MTPPENTEGFVAQLERIKDNKRKAIHLLLEEIQKDILQQEKFIQEQNVRLKESELTLRSNKDCHQVLTVAQKMIPQLNSQVQGDLEQGNQGERARLIDNDMKVINIERVAGVVESDEVIRFRKLVFRATKGKSFMFTEQFIDADERGQGGTSTRSVYIITYYDGAHTRDKIQRICDSFTGQRYNLPELSQLGADIQRMAQSVTNQRSVLDRTRHELRKQLMEFDHIKGETESSGSDGSSTIFIYRMFLAQEKALYQSLNMMRAQNDRLFGYFWAPVEYEHDIKTDLSSQTATKITPIEDNNGIQPPTFNKMTDFTWVFQQIVDTYGTPTYKEANPTPVAIVTFPFMFGLMFGDMGHGSIMAFFGLYLTLGASRLEKGALGAFVPLRYFLLLLGLSAAYCGFLYNEFFSMPVHIFKSCYDNSQRHKWFDVDGKTSNDYYY